MSDFVFVFCCLINIKHTVCSRNIARCHFKSRTDPIYCYTPIFSIIFLNSFITYPTMVYVNNHLAPHFDTFLHVFDPLGAYFQLKDDFTCLCSAPSLSAYTDILLRNSASSLSRFLKTLINLSTLITQAHPILQKSRYMILLIYTWKWAFMEEWKRTAGNGAEWGAIIVLSRLLYFHNRWRLKSKSKLNFD